VREYYEKVSVPQAPEEPDERVDRMTGLPYDMQAGGAFVDEEDRMGFSAAGLVTLIKRLTRSADDVVDDIRPTTRVDIDDDTRSTLLEFRSNEPENFVDPEDVQYSSRRVSLDNDGNRVEYRQPNKTYFITKQEVGDRLSKDLDDEINSIPEEDVDIVQEYFTSIPKVSGSPPPAASVTKQEFLKDSVEQKPQYNGSFFSTERYDNPLSVRLPRELGLHVGTKGQAETILMRGAYPFSENMVERVAARMYMDRGMTEQAARVAVSQDGVPDEVLDFIMPELMQSVPTGVTPSLREGFINVKNPLVLDTDMINWNPAKFLGGYDPDNTMRLSDQAQSFVDALEAQVKIAPEQFTSIVDTAATQIDSVLRKKDLNAGKLLNAAYDHQINTITRRMLEDLGFDSIQYKNLGELARVSEKQAGGSSYILFRDDQFVTEFAEEVAGLEKIKGKSGAPLVLYRGVVGSDGEFAEGALSGKAREGYASFASPSANVAASYSGPRVSDFEEGFNTGAITPLHVFAEKIVEFPVTVDKDGYRRFDMFEFDRRAQSLPKNHVLVARRVVDVGPRGDDITDPFKDRTFPHDVYAWRDTKTSPSFEEPPPYIRQGSLKEAIPEVKKAYDDLKDGLITADEYDKIVLNTIYPYDKVPLPETDDAMFKALRPGQRDKINAQIEEGQEVGLRLDINAYLRTEDSAWVPTIHVGKKAVGHQATASLRNVDFTKRATPKYSTAEMAQGVAEGGAKSPFAQMMGEYIDRDARENYALALEAIDSDEWIQVGFDPRRHSYFYDRATGKPVDFADEVIQIGPLVLAKNAKYGDRAKYPYATGGRVLGRLRGRAA
jgi:hypothetical protein